MTEKITVQPFTLTYGYDETQGKNVWTGLHDEEGGDDGAGAATYAPLTAGLARRINARMASLYEHTTDTAVPGNDTQTVEGHTHDRDGLDSVPVERFGGMITPNFYNQDEGDKTAEGDWSDDADLVGISGIDNGDYDTETLMPVYRLYFWHDQNLNQLVIPYKAIPKAVGADYAYYACRIYNDADSVIAADVYIADSTAVTEQRVWNFDPINIDSLTVALGVVTAAFTGLNEFMLVNGQKITIRGATSSLHNGTYTLTSVTVVAGAITAATWNNAAVGLATENPTAAVLERIADDPDSTGWLNFRAMMWVTDDVNDAAEIEFGNKAAYNGLDL